MSSGILYLLQQVAAITDSTGKRQEKEAAKAIQLSEIN
jgi:hypothetical protein